MKNKNIIKKNYCVSKYQTLYDYLLLIKMTFCLHLCIQSLKKITMRLNFS